MNKVAFWQSKSFHWHFLKGTFVFFVLNFVFTGRIQLRVFENVSLCRGELNSKVDETLTHFPSRGTRFVPDRDPIPDEVFHSKQRKLVSLRSIYFWEVQRNRHIVVFKANYKSQSVVGNKKDNELVFKNVNVVFCLRVMFFFVREPLAESFGSEVPLTSGTRTFSLICFSRESALSARQNFPITGSKLSLIPSVVRKNNVIRLDHCHGAHDIRQFRITTVNGTQGTQCVPHIPHILDVM